MIRVEDLDVFKPAHELALKIYSGGNLGGHESDGRSDEIG